MPKARIDDEVDGRPVKDDRANKGRQPWRQCAGLLVGESQTAC